MIFSPNIFLSAPLIIIGFVNLLIGFVVLFRHPRNQVHIITFVLSCGLGIWSIAVGIMTIGISHFWMREGFKLAALGGSPVPLSLLFLSLTYPDKKLDLTLFKLFLISSPAIFFSIFAPTNVWLVTKFLSPTSIKINIVPFFMNTYLLYFIIYLLLSAFNFLTSFLKSKGIKRWQILYLLLGFFTTTAIGMICNVFMVFLKQGKFVYFGPMGSVFLVAFTSYAIIAHQLFDIQVIIRRGLIFSGLVGVFFGIYAFILMFLPQIFWASGFFFIKPWFLGLLASTIIVLTFRPLEKLIAHLTDQIFFKERYDRSKEEQKLYKAIFKVVSLEEMSKKIIENISQALRLSGMGIFIFDAFDRVYKPTALSGSLKHLGEFNFALSINFHQYFLGNQEDSLATFEILEQKQREIGEALKEKEAMKRQLERDPFSYHPLFPEVKYPQYEKFRIEELKAMGEELEGIEKGMKELKVQLIIPIPGKEGIIGYLFFGDKKSLDPYFPDDLEFLKTITLAISSALQNAKHHDELQKEIKASHYHLDRAERLATLGTFALGVAHEIRNPLNSINIWAEVVEKNPDDKKAMARFVEVFKENVLRIDRVLDSMKYFGTPAHEEKEEIRMVKIIEDVLVMTSELRRKSGIKVKVDYCGLENETIYGNDYSLHQVIFNLVINAIDAIKEKKEGEGLISFILNNAALSFAEHGDQEALEIVIKDNGCGIKEENLHKIFDPMFTPRFISLN